jgi:DNA polymerase I-like protein with 3'-5' exonuclease and polymerase domains
MLNMPLSATEQHWLYNSLDCCLTHEIYSMSSSPSLTKSPARRMSSRRTFKGPVLEMRLRGILVDQQRRAEVIAEYEKQINFLSANFTRILSEGLGLDGFNWRSPAQLKDLLYVKLGLPPIKKRNSKASTPPPLTETLWRNSMSTSPPSQSSPTFSPFETLEKRSGFLRLKLT